MSAMGWLALGCAVLLAGAPAAVPGRIAALAGTGRLVAREPDARAPLRLPAPAPAVAAGVVAVAVLIAVGPALAVAAAATCLVGASLVRSARARRAQARRRAQLRAALGVLIGELDAGGRPAAALSAAAEAGPEHAAVFGAAAHASAAAGDAAAVLLRDPDTAPLGHAWRLGEDTGAALSGVLGRLADDLAAAEAQRRSVAVALSGPRSSAVVLAGLPVLGLLLGVAMGAHPERFLVGSGPGRVVCCAGVLLDLLGLVWLAAILRKAERT